jgi:DeoR/GlpR family transcriptional regulator of sugar metabolism
VEIPTKTQTRIDPILWPELLKRHQIESLRKLAQEYGVSYEAIRRTLNAAALIK